MYTFKTIIKYWTWIDTIACIIAVLALAQLSTSCHIMPPIINVNGNYEQFWGQISGGYLTGYLVYFLTTFFREYKSKGVHNRQILELLTDLYDEFFNILESYTGVDWNFEHYEDFVSFMRHPKHSFISQIASGVGYMRCDSDYREHLSTEDFRNRIVSLMRNYDTTITTIMFFFRDDMPRQIPRNLKNIQELSRIVASLAVMVDEKDLCESEKFETLLQFAHALFDFRLALLKLNQTSAILKEKPDYILGDDGII